MYSNCKIIPKINEEEGEAMGQQETEPKKTLHAKVVRGNVISY